MTDARDWLFIAGSAMGAGETSPHQLTYFGGNTSRLFLEEEVRSMGNVIVLANKPKENGICWFHCQNHGFLGCDEQQGKPSIHVGCYQVQKVKGVYRVQKRQCRSKGEFKLWSESLSV